MQWHAGLLSIYIYSELHYSYCEHISPFGIVLTTSITCFRLPPPPLPTLSTLSRIRLIKCLLCLTIYFSFLFKASLISCSLSSLLGEKKMYYFQLCLQGWKEIASSFLHSCVFTSLVFWIINHFCLLI